MLGQVTCSDNGPAVLRDTPSKSTTPEMDVYREPEYDIRGDNGRKHPVGETAKSNTFANAARKLWHLREDVVSRVQLGWSKDPGPPAAGEVPRLFNRRSSIIDRAKYFYR